MQNLPLLVDFLRMFSTTKFEGPQLLYTRALLAAFECISHLEERLSPAEQLGQHELSTVAYLQIATELKDDRIIEFTI